MLAERGRPFVDQQKAYLRLFDPWLNQGRGKPSRQHILHPLLQEPFILKVLENNRVLRRKTRFYEKHTNVRVLYGFCTGFVWLLYGILKVKPGFRLENPVFGKRQAQNQVFRLHPLFLKVLGVEGILFTLAPPRRKQTNNKDGLYLNPGSTKPLLHNGSSLSGFGKTPLSSIRLLEKG